LIPALSGDECTAVLRACGYRSLRADEHEHHLVRDHQPIVVPRVPVLDPDFLLWLLEEVQLTPTRFVELLERVDPR
jgi:hypothetical protein